MTAYTAIPNSDIDPESPITTGLITLLRDNPIAITEGTSPAPQIQSSAIAANAVNGTHLATDSVRSRQIAANTVGNSELAATSVNRAALSTLTVSLAGTLAASSVTYISLGQPYAFFPMIHALAGTTDPAPPPTIKAHDVDGASADSPRFGIENADSTGLGSYDIDFRYVAA